MEVDLIFFELGYEEAIDDIDLDRDIVLGDYTGWTAKEISSFGKGYCAGVDAMIAMGYELNG